MPKISKIVSKPKMEESTSLKTIEMVARSGIKSETISKPKLQRESNILRQTQEIAKVGGAKKFAALTKEVQESLQETQNEHRLQYGLCKKGKNAGKMWLKLVDIVTGIDVKHSFRFFNCKLEQVGKLFLGTCAAGENAGRTYKVYKDDAEQFIAGTFEWTEEERNESIEEEADEISQ